VRSMSERFRQQMVGSMESFVTLMATGRSISTRLVNVVLVTLLVGLTASPESQAEVEVTFLDAVIQPI
jgi:hypothetical protein